MKKITLNKKHKLIIGITTVILLAGGLGGYAFYNSQVQAAEVDEAQKAVQSLFSDTKQTKLANDLTEHKLEKVTQEIDEVKNTSEKKDLQISLDSAESMLKNQKEAEKAVINLYQQDDKTKFADTVSNDTIKNATDLTSKVTNDELKKELTTQVADIDKKYKAYQTADKATNALFEDSKKTALIDTTKQANLDAVKKQVDVIANDAKKETVSKNLTKAQDLLDKRNEADREAKEIEKQQEEAKQEAIANEAKNNQSNSASSTSSNDDAKSNSSSSSSSKSSAESYNNSGGNSSNAPSENSKSSSGNSSKSAGNSSSSSKTPSPSGGSKASSGGSSNSSSSKSSGSSGSSGSSKSTWTEKNKANGGTNIYEGW
ncbi:toxin Cry1Ac domain D-VI-related protein [Listeria seeligeri]